jgi:signal transduction histidine kinase
MFWSPKAQKRSVSRLRSAARFLLVLAWLAAWDWVMAQETSGLLTNASDVLALSAQQAANGIPVLVRGIVTATEPHWHGRFFAQDSTGGIFVDTSEHQPVPGDVVEVTGVSQPGAYAPIIGQPNWKKLGTAPLPPAKPVTIEQLMSGAEDGQRIETSGIVRAVTITDKTAKLDEGLLSCEITSGGYRFRAFSEIPVNIDPQTFVGAKVRIKGTAAASFNATLRRLVTTKIFVPLVTDFVVESSESINPFEQPILPLNSIAQYRRDNAPGRRVHVKGIVTYQRPGEDLFLEDASGSLHTQSRQLDTLAVGDEVEVVGFPDLDHFLPVLQDATFRKTPEPRAIVAPKAATIKGVQAGLHHAGFISLKGKLLDRVMRRDRQPASGNVRTQAVLMIQGDNSMFTAEAETPAGIATLSSIPLGSTIEVSGVCLTESEEDGTIKSFQLFLPTAKSVQILAKPSWLTPQRLLVGLAILLVILIVAVSWTVMVSRKNSTLKTLIHEKEAARLELQQAHDQLDEKVKERTAQLKFQITARNESELQSKATLAERTRLAQELHDTLAQTLTGVALQLDTTAKLFNKEPDSANQHLDLARNMIAQSQTEVRRTVWNLRCRALEEFDLPGALTTSGKQITDGSNVSFELKAKGRVRPLPEILEENLLRIAQEALTNAVKHSGATLAEIELDYGPQNIVLLVKDNGKGFAVDNCVGPRDGYFGLLGISERTKRLQGEVSFSSAPDKGTTVRVQIPIEQEFPLPDFADTQLQA